MDDLAANAERLPTIEAATVVRVTATGFEAPLVLAAVRDGGRLLTARLEVGPEALPPPGTPVALTGTETDGWTATPV
jgi:hypothetical protein